MPEFAKVSHISLSARDREASAAFYREVLGFTDLDRVEEETWRSILLLHPPSATIVEFQQHDANGGETFSPSRTGLDHLAFRVDDRAELDEWEAHLTRLGVKHSPIAEREYGSVLCFRDPDDIQLELFYRENHP